MPTYSKLKSLIYSDFLHHQAGIGNDMRLVVSDLQNLGVSLIYTESDGSKKARLLNLLKSLFFSRARELDVDFAYSSHVLPRLYDVPHIVRIHDIFPVTNPSWFKLSSRLYFKLSMKSHRQSYFLFDSNTTKEEFVEYFGQISPNRYSIMYCKIRNLNPNELCGHCNACNLDCDVKMNQFALAVGTIEPRKNYKFLLDNWSDCFVGTEGVLPLYIVGAPGWKSARTIKRLKDKNKNKDRDVIWLEKICDSSLSHFYSAAKIFVSASKAEGFNLPVKEALSYGTPVILSDISVHRELYNSQSNFFQLDSVDSFRKAVKESLKIKRGAAKHSSMNSEYGNDVELTLKKAIESVLLR